MTPEVLAGLILQAAERGDTHLMRARTHKQLNDAGVLTPRALYNIVCRTAGAKSPEAKARAAWRLSDLLWANDPGTVTAKEARLFNNFLKTFKLPWVQPIFTPEEHAAMHPELELRRKLAKESNP